MTDSDTFSLVCVQVFNQPDVRIEEYLDESPVMISAEQTDPSTSAHSLCLYSRLRLSQLHTSLDF